MTTADSPPIAKRRVGASVGLYLSAMAAAIALPFLGFVALLLLQLESNEKHALGARTEEAAQAMAVGIGRQLQDMATTLNVLGSSAELENGQLGPFHNRTQSALRSGSMYMLVVDRAGKQLLNTRVPFDTPLGNTSDLRSLRTAIDSRRVEVSDVFFGQTSQHWVFNMTLPLRSGLASGAAALILTQNVDELGRLVSDDGLPAEWSAALIDASGHLIVSSAAERPEVGMSYLPALRDRLKGFSGVIEDHGDAGATMAGFASVAGWDWKVVIRGPIATAQASILSTWRSLIIGGAVLLLLSLLSVFLFARRLRRAIEKIAGMAESLGRGEIVSPVSTGIAETDKVAMVLSEASFDRSQAEDRIHFILRELVHRTKNMLTLVQSMMRQTARHSGSIETFQSAISERLAGLARSIDLLTAEEWSGISLYRLIETHLANFLDGGNRVVIRGGDFPLKPEAIQNLGLVLHELATNALKYGALSVPQGRIIIDWSETKPEGGETMLVFKWSEQGGPAVIETERKGFGSVVIDRHATAAFRGVVAIERPPEGFRWTMTAPKAALAWEPRDAERQGSYASP